LIKLVAFFRRRPGMSVAAFQEHWRTTHASLVAGLPGLWRYVQNHTHESGYRKHEPDYDGVAEAWFDDAKALRELTRSPEYEAVREDAARFIDPESLGSVVTREVVIVDAPPREGSLKNIAFLNRRPDVSVEHFQRYWREVHGPIAARIPGNRRYVQCHTLPEAYGRGPEPRYDGVPMSWFDDLEALRTSARSPELQRTRADELNFMISGRLPFVIAREVEIAI
jgi:uncharacterized protein (TIGR02118 family)